MLGGRGKVGFGRFAVATPGRVEEDQRVLFGFDQRVEVGRVRVDHKRFLLFPFGLRFFFFQQ